MKVWITKYALTSGIFEAEAKICTNISPTMISVNEDGTPNQCFHGNDWHRTVGDALSRAEEMRIARLKSLDKQAKKIAAMKFKIVKWCDK